MDTFRQFHIIRNSRGLKVRLFRSRIPSEKELNVSHLLFIEDGLQVRWKRSGKQKKFY